MIQQIPPADSTFRSPLNSNHKALLPRRKIGLLPQIIVSWAHGDDLSQEGDNVLYLIKYPPNITLWYFSRSENLAGADILFTVRVYTSCHGFKVFPGSCTLGVKSLALLKSSGVLQLTSKGTGVTLCISDLKKNLSEMWRRQPVQPRVLEPLRPAVIVLGYWTCLLLDIHKKKVRRNHKTRKIF